MTFITQRYYDLKYLIDINSKAVIKDILLKTKDLRYESITRLEEFYNAFKSITGIDMGEYNGIYLSSINKDLDVGKFIKITDN